MKRKLKEPTEAMIVEGYLDAAEQSLQRAIDQSYRTPMVSALIRNKLKRAYDTIDTLRVTIKVKINRKNDKIAYNRFVEGIDKKLKDKQCFCNECMVMKVSHEGALCQRCMEEHRLWMKKSFPKRKKVVSKS